MSASEPARRVLPPLAKAGLDLGPVVVFFLANLFFGIFVATAVFMPLVILALVADYAIERRIAPVPLVSAVFVLVLGGLTLWLGDDRFIKIKPTLFYIAAAAFLAIGLRFNRLYIKALFAAAFELPDAAWRVLTWRVAGYCVALAICNEIVWRNFSNPIWAGFKLGLIPLTFCFMAAQIPFIMRHQIEEAPPPA